VLIDYESVQPSSMTALEQECIKVIIFVGEKQTKVAFELAASLQQLGARVAYVKISGSGPNALDFHIAFYIGQLAAAEPNACFHIISKDTGFDPLITHLKSKKISVTRSKDVAEILIAKPSIPKSQSERHVAILANLRQRGSSKPRTVKTLSSTINSMFQKLLSDAEIAGLLEDLQKQGIISIAGNSISYALPE
jgi:hypothetical protein